MQLHTNKSKKRHYFILATATTSAAVIILAVIFMLNTIGKKSSPSSTEANNSGLSTQSQSANQTPASSTSNSSGPTSTSAQSTPETTPTISASITPVAPSGTFVSNHHLSLSTNPTVTSTCSTTPGATCTISFKQGDLTRSLGAKTSDANGNASWTWTIKDLGLTTGAWSISATAANGDNASTTNDSLDVVVSE